MLGNTSAALRCAPCDLNWPVSPAFDACPGCGDATYEAEGERAMTLPQAHTLRDRLQKQAAARATAHAAFDAYCDLLDFRRDQLATDPARALYEVLADATATTHGAAFPPPF